MHALLVQTVRMLTTLSSVLLCIASFQRYGKLHIIFPGKFGRSQRRLLLLGSDGVVE
jgi:hypothetical protein